MDIIHSSQKYLEQLQTSSKPLRIVDKQLQIYYCKTFSRHYKKKYIFVEFLCYYILDMLRYSIPESKIIIVDNSHLIGSSYESFNNANTLFLASKSIDDSILLDNIGKTVKSYKKLPIQRIIEIAFFDYVFLNLDRHQENSNLLITRNEIYAIDHAQCFNYSNDIVDPVLEILSQEESILFHTVINYIIKKNSKEIINISNIVIQEFLSRIDNILELFDDCVIEFSNHFGDDVDFNWYRNCLENVYFQKVRIEAIIQIFLEDIRR